jgi:hypothetical protein
MTLQLPSGEHFYSAHLLIYQTCPVQSSFILNFSFRFLPNPARPALLSRGDFSRIPDHRGVRKTFRKIFARTVSYATVLGFY